MLQLCTSPKPASSSIPTFAMASGIKRELNGGDKRLDMTLDQSFSIPPSHLAFLPSCWPLLGLVHTAKLAFDEQFLCYPWVSLQCRTSCACFKPLHYNQAPSDQLLLPCQVCHQTWKAGIPEQAVVRKEGAIPNGFSEVPGSPAFWLEQPSERERPSAELNPLYLQASIGIC